MQLSLSRSPIYRVLHIINATPVLCHAVTLNAQNFTQNYYILNRHSQGQMFSFRFAVLHVAWTKGLSMSWVFIQCIWFRCIWFRCIWFYSMCIGFSQPPILASIQSVVNRVVTIQHYESIYSGTPDTQSIHSGTPDKQSIHSGAPDNFRNRITGLPSSI